MIHLQKWVGKFGVGDEFIIGQGVEEGDQVGLILGVEVEAAWLAVIVFQQRIEIGVILHAVVVEGNHFGQGLETAVVHIRSGYCNVS